MALTHNTNQLIKRIQARTKGLSPDSPALNQALTRIGLYITAVAKLNVRGQNLIDTGRLLNSIRYEFFRDGTNVGIRVGSFNVPYAAVHEFGFHGSQNVPAHSRLMTTAFGRKVKDPRRIEVAAHSRVMNIRARPYLRPAIRTTGTFVLDTLRAALLVAKQGK